MINSENSEKVVSKNFINKTINYLKKLGHVEIKADVKGYESPKSFEMKSEHLKITPDIVSVSSDGKVHYVEVGVKSENPVTLKSKWKFLKKLAEINGRGFKIVSHRGHYSFTDKLVIDLNYKQGATRI